MTDIIRDAFDETPPPSEAIAVIYASGERFRWEARDRTTQTIYREDENGLGSFTQLDSERLDQVSLYMPLDGGEVGIHLDIPEGAKAVFVRRRTIRLDPSAVNPQSLPQPVRLGYTIVGYQFPDGAGLYHFFNDIDLGHFESDNFNAV